MKRIGIVGGSFNPIHDGHVHIMQEAYRHLALDNVWMWVSHNIFKDPASYSPLDDRLELCDIYTKSLPWLKAQTFESNFHDTKTASSMTILDEMFPDTKFIWVFGDDNFASFHHWNDTRFRLNGKIVPDWQYMMHKFSIAVMHRPGYHDDAVNGHAAHYGRGLHIPDPKDLATDTDGWSFIDNSMLSYSSTSIKEAIRRGDKNIPGLNPEAEAIIYNRGLYTLGNNFKAATLPHMVNNPVRFQTFITFAATINLVKSLSLHSRGVTDLQDFKDHFDVCWDKSHAKGDYKKYDDVPGEIADCLISLYWVADKIHHSLDSNDTLQETQQSVSEWCDKHYPDRDLQQRLFDYVEELAELCVCEGLEKHRALNLIQIMFDAPDLAKPDMAITNCMQKLKDYAEDVGHDLGCILDAKMQTNRQHTTQQSMMREGQKRHRINSLKQG